MNRHLVLAFELRIDEIRQVAAMLADFSPPRRCPPLAWCSSRNHLAMKITRPTFVWQFSFLVLLLAAPALAQEKTAEDKTAALRADLEKRFGDKVEVRF